MQRYRTLVVLAVVVAVAAAAAVLVQREDTGIEKSGEKLLPGLLEQLGAVSRIESTHKGETVTLILADGSWSVAERDGYRAETSEVRGLLVGAAELVRVEPKTSRPESYAKLELGDPADAEGESFGYVMKDAAGKTIADLVVGKRRFVSATTPDIDEYFVRVPGDPQTWLVSGKIPRNRRALDWLWREVTKIDQTRVRRAAVIHPDGTVVRVTKPSPKEADFTLEGVPEGHEVKEPFSVHAIGTALATFTLNDVARLEEVDFSGEGLDAVAETFDGVRLIARIIAVGERTFVRMAAEFDPGLVFPETTEVAAGRGGGARGSGEAERTLAGLGLRDDRIHGQEPAQESRGHREAHRGRADGTGDGCPARPGPRPGYRMTPGNRRRLLLPPGPRVA